MEKFGEILDAIDVFVILAEKVYGPYRKGPDGSRKIVIIKNDDGTTRTVSWPKYLMEKHLGRTLDKDKGTIDHWDSNIDNNAISNLRVVPRSEHSSDDTRRVKLVKFKCPWCKKDFERSPRLIRDKAKKGRSGPFCSRICAGRYSRKLRLKLIDKFDVQKAIDSEYYKKKYVKASVVVEDELIYVKDVGVLEKYAIDIPIIDMDTGERKPIAFQTGDLVRHQGKLAKFLCQSVWDDPDFALIRYVNKDGTFVGKPHYHYVRMEALRPA